MRLEAQLINRILSDGDLKPYFESGISLDLLESHKDEMKYILDNYEKYSIVVDKTNFNKEFPNFQFTEIVEPVKFFGDKLREQMNFQLLKQTLEETSKLATEDSFEATKYLQTQMKKLMVDTSIKTVDIVHDISRGEVHREKLEGDRPAFISTGLKELDSFLGGYYKGEELVVGVGRTGVGKSWWLVKTLIGAWQQKLRVAMISPEMSAQQTGYRFDTLFGGYSNKALISGMKQEGYVDFLDALSHNPIPFFVSTPADFGRNVTVSKLREFCISNKIDVLGIDGITYLKDERRIAGQNKTATLTNIAEDLMDLSVELQIPIITVVQANRGATEEGVTTPELEHIRDSDGIAHNASKVIGISLSNNVLELAVKKNRYGETGGFVKYNFLADTGEYSYLPDDLDSVHKDLKKENKEELEEIFNSEEQFQF